MKLVKYNGNWADEFDTKGFMLVSEGTWEQYLENLEVFFENLEGEEYEHYFGTNEWFTFDSLKGYVKDFKVEEISDAEVVVLQKLFGSPLDNPYGNYGIIPIIEDAWYANEVDEDEQE